MPRLELEAFPHWPWTTESFKDKHVDAFDLLAFAKWFRACTKDGYAEVATLGEGGAQGLPGPPRGSPAASCDTV